MISVWDLVSWGLWIAWAAAIASFIAGVVLKVLGREGYERLLAGSLASMLILAFGWGLVQALYGGVAPGLPYGWVFYAVSGILLVLSAIYLAIGRSEGVSHLVAGLLVVGLGFFATSLATGVNIGAGGTISVTAIPSTTTLNNGGTLSLAVIPEGGDPPYTVVVSWGDGSKSTGVIGGNASISFTHSYSIPGNTPASSFSIRVDVVDSKGRTGWNILAVVVENQDYCPLGWPWGMLCTLYRAVTTILPAVDVQKLVENPIFPTSSDDPIYGLYQMVLNVSMATLGLFLAFDIIWRSVNEGVLSIADSLKDAVVVVSMALLAPYVYNATAQALNTVSFQLIGQIDISWVLAWIFLQLALGVILGYFVPFLANYAAFLAVTLFLASVVVYVRYILITTLVAASPLIAVAYLHPVLRGAVRHVVGLLAGLMLAGPIAAVFMVVMNMVVPGRNITFGILYPLIVGVLPSVLGVFGAGLVTHLAGAFKAGIGALIGRAGGGSPQPTAGGGPASMASVQGQAPRVKLQVLRPGPIITPTTVRVARREAGMAKGVAATVAESRRIGPGITFTLQGPEAASKHAEELAKEPEVHPRWEAFKAGVKSLGSQAGRRVWINMKTLAGEYKGALKHHLGRELNVRFGHASIHGWRAGGGAEHGGWA
jgi:carbon starvation protein